MKRGVCFEIEETHPNVLSEIFSFFCTENFVWHIVKTQTEAWDVLYQKDFFEKEIYDTGAITELAKNEQHIIFLKAQAYRSSGMFQDVSSYDQFKESECQAILLVYDCCSVEIYAKNQNVLEQIFEFMRKQNQIVYYITDESDQRTTMSVK